MHEPSPRAGVRPVAHQFEDAVQQYETARLGMWAFLVTEVMFFGGLFTGYAVYRGAYPHAFGEASRRLDVTLGAFNTAALLLSSYAMALAVNAAERGRRKALTGFLALTFVLGTVFLGVKSIEYAHKFREHLVPGPHFSFEGFATPQAPLFFSFYFAMTGMHALHMVIGMTFIAAFAFSARRGRFEGHATPVELLGLYWHFVDIVWIFLFPLLYLVGRHR